MEISALKAKIKELVLKNGAKLVGIGSKERLEKAPPSADMDYCLKGAKRCIIWAYPNPIDALENYFSKKERFSIKKFQHFAYKSAWDTALKVKEYIENKTIYKAFAIIPNGKYRSEGSFSNIMSENDAYPEFSLRYGAVAAGLGHLGWSGNLVTEKFGGSLYLGGALTTAPLEPDPMPKENHCNNCMLCHKACTTGFFDKVKKEERHEVIIGGFKETYAKRGAYSKCGVGCAGWTGLSQDGTWSTWTPDHISLKDYSDQEWKENPSLKKKLMRELLMDKKTPKEVKEFNKAILKSYSKVTKTENSALRTLEDTNPRCGNCNFICVADTKKRKELFNLLKSSGKVYLDEQGREYLKKMDSNGKEIIFYPPSEEEFFEGIKNK
ncbi:MAG: putative Fe-S protein [Promethearchaeota archaeon]|nr:MAG: putative Fe-S protein [Candidatus Lokiarchaeota archaeon]